VPGVKAARNFGAPVSCPLIAPLGLNSLVALRRRTSLAASLVAVLSIALLQNPSVFILDSAAVQPAAPPHARQTLSCAEKHQLRAEAPGPPRATAPVTATALPRLLLQQPGNRPDGVSSDGDAKQRTFKRAECDAPSAAHTSLRGHSR
jgi:hypothetical protein